MLFLVYLSQQYEYTSANNYKLDLTAGYYSVTIRAGQGGSACNKGKETSHQGGRGAKIGGTMHITGSYTYDITVGSHPGTRCKDHQNFAGNFGEGGDSGYDSDKDGEQGGAGGGYSSITNSNTGEVIAIAGAGGGAAYGTDGAPGGGTDYHFGCDGDDGGVVRRRSNDGFLMQYRHGGKGDDYSYIPGSGGGGGSRGGGGGRSAMVMQSCTCGYSGLSSINYKFWTQSQVSDGWQHSETGDGYISIVPNTVCAKGCNDCLYGNGNACTSCLNGYSMYGTLCYSSCGDTPVPTYQSGSKCMNCPAGCAACTNGTSCSRCKSNQVLWNGKCMPTPSPKPSPVITPSITPSMTPSITPSSTPSSTPASTPSSTPSSTPASTPSITPSITPSTTPSETPSITPSDTPSITPSDTPSDTPTITPSITPSDTPSSTPSSTPSDTPSDTPSSTPSSTPSETPSSTPSSTPSDTPSTTPQTTPHESPVETIPMTPKQTSGIEGGDGKANINKRSATKSKKLSLGILIAIIVGCLILITLIIVGIYFAVRGKDKSDSYSSQQNSSDNPTETVICDPTTAGTTIDNPIFSTTVDIDSDPFERDFEEEHLDQYFGIDAFDM